jgi:serine/threonine protein kinase
MSWPTPQEYNEAIQNPRTAFADPELKQGQPVLTPLGLPRPITGGFASVYQIVTAPQRTYAVRCFLREFGDYQERYAEISAHLAANPLPYMVNFAFLPQGILVGGRWFPILKMEWIDGESLHTYVERNLQQPQKLIRLADQWVEMVQNLHERDIAHGDLQHGNVLVVQDRLRLIDYDGMYVPRLATRQSHEIGHRNYQHPARSETYFASNMDFFLRVGRLHLAQGAGRRPEALARLSGRRRMPDPAPRGFRQAAKLPRAAPADPGAGCAGRGAGRDAAADAGAAA